MVGCPHPDYLPPDLTTAHLADWQEYSTQFGYRSDILFGLLTQAVCNAYGGKVDLEEVMPYQRERLADPEEVAMKLESFFPELKGK